MTKPVQISLRIHLPDDHEADRVAVHNDGTIKILDKSGNELDPAKVERSVHYHRPKGPKYQTKSVADALQDAVGGLGELAQLDHFIVIDTNTSEVQGVRVSAAYFVVCRLEPEDDSFRVVSVDGYGHCYEFHNVPGNPEMLAILKVANDTVRTAGLPDERTIGFVTDSEMTYHEAISERERPIYGESYLPSGFNIAYASADTGAQLTNKLIRFCDSQSTRYLKRLAEGAFRTTGLATLDEDRAVYFRYTYYPSLEIINPVITGITTTPETRHYVKFYGNSQE